MKAINVVDNEIACMTEKRCTKGKKTILLLLPETDNNGNIIKRFLFWNVIWKTLHSLGWILDTEGNEDSSFFVIPPLPPVSGSMRKNLDYFNDEIDLISSFATDPRFLAQEKLCLLRAEFAFYVDQFNELKCSIAGASQYPNVISSNHIPLDIILSNESMLWHLKTRVMERHQIRHAVTLGNKIKLEISRLQTFENQKKRERDQAKRNLLTSVIAIRNRQQLDLQRIVQEQQRRHLKRRIQQDTIARHETILTNNQRSALDLINQHRANILTQTIIPSSSNITTKRATSSQRLEILSSSDLKKEPALESLLHQPSLNTESYHRNYMRANLEGVGTKMIRAATNNCGRSIPSSSVTTNFNTISSAINTACDSLLEDLTKRTKTNQNKRQRL